MKRNATLGVLTGLMVAVALIAVGCSGSDGTDDVTPPPSQDTGTLNGQVVSATNVRSVVSNAVVTVQPTGQVASAQAGARTVTTGADGGFAFRNLPAGTWTISVTTPQSEDFGTGLARVPVARNETTTVSLAVLPLGLPAPEQISVDPTNVTIDVQGRVTFRAQVRGAGNQTLQNITPTWVVEGGIGPISPEGVFTAQHEGTGRVTAYSGNATRSSTVVVVGPRPPQISSFRVNPVSLPAAGGEVVISAAIRDGDGINPEDVIVEIRPPAGDPIELPMQVSNPDRAVRCPITPDCFVAASFGATFEVPANDNRPTGEGVQSSQTYAVSVRATDGSDATSQSELVEFVVQGIDSPPVRPGI